MWPLKKKQEQKVECQHDWQYIETCPWLWKIGDRFIISHATPDQKYKNSLYQLENMMWDNNWRADEPDVKDYVYLKTHRKVCLTCGECIDEIALASDYIHAKWDEEDRREALSAKMWEECKGEDNTVTRTYYGPNGDEVV